MFKLVHGRLNINACLILLILLIMIDGKLTPVVYGAPPTYLYEWVDDVQD